MRVMDRVYIGTAPEPHKAVAFATTGGGIGDDFGTAHAGIELAEVLLEERNASQLSAHATKQAIIARMHAQNIMHAQYSSFVWFAFHTCRIMSVTSGAKSPTNNDAQSASGSKERSGSPGATA
jgi:hypothetical protein